MTRIDKAYSLLFHPLRENRGPKRTFQCISAWIASFGLAPAIVGGIKKHRISAESQLEEMFCDSVNREIEPLEKHTLTTKRIDRLKNLLQERPDSLSDEQKERLEALGKGANEEDFEDVYEIIRPKTELLEVLSEPAVNDLLFHFLGDESYKLQNLAIPYVDVFLKKKLDKINRDAAQSLKELGMRTIDEVMDFTKAHGGKITSLNLSEYTISDEHLEVITRNCPLLIKLNISSPFITHIGFRNFSQNLNQLQELHLNSCFNITDADVGSIVRNQRELTTLSLRDTGITDIGVQFIAEHLKKLKNLDLSLCRIESEGINAITENLVDLQELNLSGCSRLVIQDVMAIAQSLTNLKGLYLDFTTRLDSETSNLIAKRLLKLTHLSLNYCNITTADIIILSESLNNLKMLNVSNCNISDHGARAIAVNLPDLEELYLDNTLITNRGVIFLAEQLHQLKTLHIAYRSLTSDSIVVIAQNLTQLTDLDLSGATINDEAAAAIVEHLKGLTSLNLQSCDIDDLDLVSIVENLENLKRLNVKLLINNPLLLLNTIATHQKNLEELKINGVQQVEGFLGVIENLRNLKALDLSDSLVGDDEARAIARNLTKLEDLNLSGCIHVGNSSYKYLMKNLKNLKTVDLSDNQIDSSILYAIAKHQKTLLHLSLGSFNFSNKGVISISINVPTLRTLNLLSCTKITDRSIHAILQNLNLKYLRFASCPRVTQEARAAVQAALN